MLFNSYKFGSITLSNRLVMAPMTRCRAIGNVPNALMAEYYSQRATAGLIITEGVAPSANGLGYARIPGVYRTDQVEGWKLVADAVHRAGGHIFMQLMHTGRVSHPANMEPGAIIVAPSALALEGKMHTDAQGSQPYPTPKAMTLDDIAQAQDEFVQAAKNAIAAGFDGVELHGANGYLIDQFINPGSNLRTDMYGGSIENRNRFAIEVATKVAAAIGADRTAMRLSPNGVASGMSLFPEVKEAYVHLTEALGRIGLVYIHVADHSAMGAPAVGEDLKAAIAAEFGGTIIHGGSQTPDTAEALTAHNDKVLVAFGRNFISNPDLVSRLQHGQELAQPDFRKFYTPGAEGYTDYPVFVG
jgi:N-ethylmaleimide reductase